MALTFSNALTVAQLELNRVQHFANLYALLPESTTETQYGWLIPWAQRDYRATKEVIMAGNGPFFVDKYTGQVSQLGFFQISRFQDWLAEYAIEHGYHSDGSRSGNML